MASLIYSVISSLDGYIEDQSGNFDWAAPDQEVHAFVNDMERPVGTYIYGRRMYQTMLFWEKPENLAGEPPVMQDFATIWRSADKLVFSRTITAVSSARTRLKRQFDPGSIARMKATSGKDISIGGPELAAVAIRNGLVDELRLLLAPIIVGGGKPSLPRDLRVRLELVEQRRFDNGVVYLDYAVAG